VRADRSVRQALDQGLRANPAYLWRECNNCGARFRQRHYGDGSLEPVGDDEWAASVVGK
jgi:hypothetical protein